MSMFYERWIRIVFLILMGIALVVLPRFLPTVPEFGDSDKFAIQFFSFLAVSALIGLELLIAGLQGTRAVLRGETSKLSYMAGATAVVIVLGLFVWQTWYSAAMVLESVATLYVFAFGYLIIRGIAGIMRRLQPRMEAPPPL